MTNREIRKDLNGAKEIYHSKNYQEAFDIYDKHYFMLLKDSAIGTKSDIRNQ